MRAQALSAIQKDATIEEIRKVSEQIVAIKIETHGEIINVKKYMKQDVNDYYTNDNGLKLSDKVMTLLTDIDKTEAEVVREPSLSFTSKSSY